MNPTPSRIRRRLLSALFALTAVAAPTAARALEVEIWTDRGDDAVYKSGETMGIKVRASEDAYLLVYEIDAVGQVNLLFPFRRGSALVPGKETLRLPPDDSGTDLVIGDVTGQGFLVAVASEQPFRELPWFLRPFDPQAASIGYEGVPSDSEPAEEGFDDTGKVVGDPYVAMERIRRRVVSDPASVQGTASDYTTYYVHEVVRYPRYLCNDCHRPGYWAWWSGFDPYYWHCSTFDFRVNWSWYWGPYLWTSYVPYYYYVVRSDCPPMYSTWYGPNYRFTSWDGWNRWTDLWGGQLRRFKPTAAPASYTPPPPRGMIWRKGETPPGFVGPDVRTRTSAPGGGMRDVFNRQRDKSAPAWREKPSASAGGTSRPAVRPDGRSKPSSGDQGSGSTETVRTRRGGNQPGADSPSAGDAG